MAEEVPMSVYPEMTANEYTNSIIDMLVGEVDGGDLVNTINRHKKERFEGRMTFADTGGGGILSLNLYPTGPFAIIIFPVEVFFFRIK